MEGFIILAILAIAGAVIFAIWLFFAFLAAKYNGH